jgi:SsrA-binding protein
MSKAQKPAQKPAKAPAAEKPAVKVVCDNRRARHEYEVLDVFQAGIELVGTEVKSMRQGKANLQDSFAKVEAGQLWLYNCHVSPYDFGNRFNHDPVRRRRLLMHKGEIRKLGAQIKEK